MEVASGLLNKCEKQGTGPKRSLSDFLAIKGMKDVLPLLPAVHGFVIKALPQGDLEVSGAAPRIFRAFCRDVPKSLDLPVPLDGDCWRNAMPDDKVSLEKRGEWNGRSQNEQR